jgi:hypothetical protein
LLREMNALAFILHIGAGAIGLASGTVAALARKGGRVHRRAGTVFVISMLVMATSFSTFTPGTFCTGGFWACADPLIDWPKDAAAPSSIRILRRLVVRLVSCGLKFIHNLGIPC